MAQLSCFQTIRSRFASLTGAEQKIAQYILENGDRVVQMSVGELSKQTGAAKSAVIRCCKSLGFEGYPQLKLTLASELSKNEQLNYVPYIYPEDDPITIMKKVFSANVKALHDTADQITAETLEPVLELLGSARKIFLYGVGTSASMVLELKYRLILLGYSAFAFTDPATMKISTMNIDKRDVALGISHSGRTIATTEVLSLAKNNGAATICITSYPESPITKICRHSLVVCSDEVRYPVEAMSAKIAQLSLIYAMTTALSAREYEQTLDRAKKTRALIGTIRLEE